jgi:hypothetical protein
LLDASTGTPTDLNVTGASPKALYANNMLAGNKVQLAYTVSAASPTGWTLADYTTYMNRADGGNTFLTNCSDAGLADAFQYNMLVDYNPTSGSPALNGASFTSPKLSTWFTPTTYRGACAEGDNWWKGWTRFGN